MQFISKRTYSLKRPHVLHVANPPGIHRQEGALQANNQGHVDAAFTSYTNILLLELNKDTNSYNIAKVFQLELLYLQYKVCLNAVSYNILSKYLKI